MLLNADFALLLAQNDDPITGLQIILILLFFAGPVLALYLYHVVKAKIWEFELLPIWSSVRLRHIMNAFVCATVLIIDADRRDSKTKIAQLHHTLKKFDVPSHWVQYTVDKVWEDHVGIKHLARWMNRRLSEEDREMLLYMLVEMSVSDGAVTSKEFAILEDLGKRIGFSTRQIQGMIAAQRQKQAREEAQSRQRDHKRREAYTSVPSASKREQAAEIFGISPLASPAEIKKTYRILVKKYHPDRFANQSETAVKVAHERFIEIQEAYESLSSQ